MHLNILDMPARGHFDLLTAEAGGQTADCYIIELNPEPQNEGITGNFSLFNSVIFV